MKRKMYKYLGIFMGITLFFHGLAATLEDRVEKLEKAVKLLTSVVIKNVEKKIEVENKRKTIKNNKVKSEYSIKVDKNGQLRKW